MAAQEATSPASVAFVALKAYPLFDGSVPTLVGGMETRAAIFARALAKTGRWKVSFAVTDHGQGKVRNIDDVCLVVYNPLIARVERNVISRFYKYKWRPVFHLDRRDVDLLWQFPLYLITRLLPEYWRRRFWRSLQPPPQIVCCFGNNSISAEVIAECKRSGIKTVLCVASDGDLSASYKPDDKALNNYKMPNWMAHYVLTNADQVFVQTESQLRTLEERFGRHGGLVRNPIDISIDDPARWPARRERDLILWIGRSDTFNKRPLLLLELARRCPDLPFLMILNKAHADVFDAVLAQKPSNLTVIERVPHRDIWDYYRRARIFVSTSTYEGFPNTFLQCAVTGVPVVSLTVDPGEILTNHGCGLLANDSLDSLERHVRHLWSDMELAERQALAFHNYVIAHHGLDSQVERFESLLREVISQRTGPTWRFRWGKPWRRFISRNEN
jgi:glycosyltransferase involved in cell wall biosynthesis